MSDHPFDNAGVTVNEFGDITISINASFVTDPLLRCMARNLHKDQERSDSLEYELRIAYSVLSKLAERDPELRKDDVTDNLIKRLDRMFEVPF